MKRSLVWMIVFFVGIVVPLTMTVANAGSPPVGAVDLMISTQISG